jgi:hypothetical protein
MLQGCSSKLGLMCLLSLFCFSDLRAEDPPLRGEAQVLLGISKYYLDEPAFLLLGGAVRFPFSRRVSIGPEISVFGSEAYSIQSLQGNLFFDLTSAAKVVPYVTAGVGISWQTQHSIRYTSKEMVALGGVGGRIRINKYLRISPQIRAGWSAFPQATLGIGFCW